MARGNEEIGNLIVRVGLDGSDFQKGIKNVNRQMSLAQSELRATAGVFKDAGASADQLKAKIDSLGLQQKLQAERVRQLREQYEKLVETKGKDAEVTLRAGAKVNNAIGTYKKLQTQLEKTSAALHRQDNNFLQIGNHVGEVSDKIKTFGSSLNDIGRSLTFATTIPIGLATAGLINMATQFSDSQHILQAQLGLTTQEAAKLNKAAADIWQKGFGQDLDQVRESLGMVRQYIKGISDEDMKKVTIAALNFNKVFGADTKDTVKTTSNLMKNFKIDSKQALDIITTGFQKGGDFSNELLDTLNEYGVQFASLGFDAKGFLNILIEGAKNGAFNLDKVGDAVKEFGLRSKDGSKTTAQGYKLIGMNASKMAEEIAKGGTSAQKAFAATVAGLAAMKDPYKQNLAGIDLFGTQWEDVRKNVVLAMDVSKNKIKGLDGATDRLNKTMEENPAQQMAAKWRSLQKQLLPLANKTLDFATKELPKLTEGISNLIDNLEALSPGEKKMLLWLTGIVAIGGPAAFAIGSIIKVMGHLVAAGGLAFKGVGKVSEAFGKIGRTGGTAVVAAEGMATVSTRTERAAVSMAKMSRMSKVASIGMAAMGGPVGIAIAGIAALTIGGIALYHNMQKKVLPAVDLFKGGVSDATKKSLGAFEDLKQGADTKLKELYWSSTTITKNTADSLVKTFDTMGEDIKNGLDKKFNESYKIISNFLTHTAGMSKEKQREILNDLIKRHQKEKDEVDNEVSVVQGILQKAADEHRGLTQSEYDTIYSIQANMGQKGIDNLTKNKQEQETILKNLKKNSGIISAEQAAEIIKHSRTTTSNTISEAQKKYDAVVSWAKQQKKDGGVISKQEADEIIAAAQGQRDSTIKMAKDQEKNVVAQAWKQAGNHKMAIDKETGDILTSWDQAKIQVADDINWFSKGINWVLSHVGIHAQIPMWKPKGYDSYVKGSKLRGYARGTNFHPGGIAMVGEEGPELTYMPKKGMGIVGLNGPQLVDLPRGTSVLPNKETKKILHEYNIPGYAGGVGDFFKKLLVGGPEKVLSYVWSRFSPNKSYGHGDLSFMVNSVASYLKDKASNFIKGKLPDPRTLIEHAKKTVSHAGHSISNLFHHPVSTFKNIASGIGSFFSHPLKSVGSFFKNLFHFANGGIATKPMYATLAENGWKEYIIPTQPSERKRALELLKQAALDLGVSSYGAPADLIPSSPSTQPVTYNNSSNNNNNPQVIERTVAPEYVAVNVVMDKQVIAKVLAKPIQTEQSKLKNKNNRAMGMV